ncbi:MAG TPA: peptidylprolyl isomerase [Vicinamibacterales bacterium]|nr:peptidylprolyl isomerase [Vicinamibacterales bacterium]
MSTRHALTAAVAILLAAATGQRLAAQPPPARLTILEAEDRRAPAARDLAIIRGGLHSGDAETVRIAVRALGRLERPALVGDIAPLLRHPLPEVRAEAANAIGQAVQPLVKAPAKQPAVRRTGGAADSPAATIDGAMAPLVARLNVEAEPSVRAALCETIGRMAATADQATRAEGAIVGALGHDESNEARVGVAKGLAALFAAHRSQHFAEGTIAAARALARVTDRDKADPAREARVRRLALEGLTSLRQVDDGTLVEASRDPDAQVRRLAMHAAGDPDAPLPSAAGVRQRGLADAAAMVRLEAIRAEAAVSGAGACAASVAAVKDRDVRVVLTALDQLAACRESPDALTVLQRTVDDLSLATSPRGWHRAAHALVALAAASPEAAAPALRRYAASSVWQLRMYSARAATVLKDRAALETLAADASDNVVEAAVEGLSKVAAHEADAIYVKALGRTGYQAVRAASRALGGSPSADAAPALDAALERLVAEGHDNSHDARDAIEEALDRSGAKASGAGDGTGGGAKAGSPRGARAAAGRPAPEPESDLNADDLHRLASPRARITIRGLGTFELALFTAEAPATVLRFARLAESGYYNGLTFHRVVPNFVIQGGSPGANEYVGDARFMRDELGLWPHVRGAVGISTRGRDTGDAQFFVDLVDNPRLDHDYTVFAQVLNGMDVVDQILEGDVIEKIDIVAN